MQGRILIVEDHPTMRGALRLILESEGLDVEEASDGARALVAIRDAPPDVVFLDLNIPGTSGAQVLADDQGRSVDRRRPCDRRSRRRGRRGGRRRCSSAPTPT